MGNNIKKISRSELYHRVWETPVTQLAKEYGLSDVGFAKICKKFNIPRPPRGYWAKKVSGQHLQKAPLPKRSSNEIIEINPNTWNQVTGTTNFELAQKIEAEKKYPPIIVPKALRNPHPFIQQSQQILELCQPNDVGIIEPKDKNCLDIRVSKKSLPRALRILNALINALLERGFEVFQEDGSLKVEIENEYLGIGISEEIISKKTQPRDTKLDGYYQFGHSRFDYVRIPSGKLCLSIHDRGHYWGDNFRKNWRDKEKKQVEDCLDDFIIGLHKRIAQKKEYRRKEEERERQRRELARQREEEERRRAELERIIRLEKARVAKLITDADNYEKSRLIREFIDAVENERSACNPVYVTDQDHETWIKWANEQADRLDPLSHSPASILDQATETDKDGDGDDKKPENPFKRW